MLVFYFFNIVNFLILFFNKKIKSIIMSLLSYETVKKVVLFFFINIILNMFSTVSLPVSHFLLLNKK